MSEFTLIPEKLVFSPKKTNEHVEGFVVLQVPQDRRIVVEGTEIDSANLHVDSVDVKGLAGGIAFRVWGKADKEGSYQIGVRFLLRGPMGETFRVPLQVLYQSPALDSK